MAIALGADSLGLVSHMPSGPGVIEEDRIAEIVSAVPPPVATFLLTSSQDPQYIIKQINTCRINTVQLVDQVDLSVYPKIRSACPHIKIVQVLHVIGNPSLKESAVVSPHVDALLLDSGNPGLPVKELGGTGRVHDWHISRQIREQIDIPVFLAGGLTEENVDEAIRTVEPYGVDVCSGVRQDGLLDGNRLSRFVNKVQSTQRTHPL
jgi:phosphoribosylanthranilate isomerase